MSNSCFGPTKIQKQLFLYRFLQKQNATDSPVAFDVVITLCIYK